MSLEADRMVVAVALDGGKLTDPIDYTGAIWARQASPP